MNKLFFLLLLLDVSVANAQTTVFRKIAQRHDSYKPSSSAWQGVDSFRWDYNANATLTQLTALKEDIANNWNNLYRYIYTLNADEKVTVQIRENWNGSSWVNSTRYTNDYDANGDLITVHYDTWNGSAWNTAGKIEYAGYNVKHKYASETTLIWSGTAWTYLSKDLYQYCPTPKEDLPQIIEKYNWNASFIQWDSVERLYFTYNMDSVGSKIRSVPYQGSWLQDSKETTTFSTTPFHRTEYLVQLWDTSANPDVWKNDKRILYTYNTSDSLEKTASDKYTGGTWYSEARSNYVYNGSNQKSEFYTELYSGSWSNDFRQTFSYTGSNLTQEIQYTGLGSGWEETKRLDYTFDINNLNTFRQIDTFNGAVFIPNNRDFYYYNAMTVNTNDVMTSVQAVSLYPNPASDMMTLALSSDKVFNASLRVSDLSGKCHLMILQPVFIGKNNLSIPVSSLPSGLYLLQFMDRENGTQITRTFEVSK